MNRLSILQDWRGIVLLVVCLASSLLLIHAIDHDMPQNHNDLIGRWVGTRAAFQGQSPYSEQTLQKIQTAYYGRPLTSEDKVLPQGFYYPAPAILFFWPTTWFNFATVRLSFLLIMPVLLLISFWQCFDIAKIYPPLRSRFLFCAIALSFLPTVWGLRLLQPTLLMIPPVIAACWLVAHEKTVLAGMILAPIMLKPQLILPLIVWLCFWTLLRHKPGFTISFQSLP